MTESAAQARPDPAPIPVAVIGAGGRMGAYTVQLIGLNAKWDVVATYGRDDDWAEPLRASGARIAVDFTVAGRGYAHGARILAAGVRPLIGTSGVMPDEVRALDAQARELELGGAVVPNFSLGIWCLNRAVHATAPFLSEAEIVETHHDRKRDAPSSTAADIARRIRAETGRDVPVHSLRLPGFYAHHEVVLGSVGESLTIRHDMAGPEAFGPGILAALAFVGTARSVVHGFDGIFEAALARSGGPAAET